MVRFTDDGGVYATSPQVPGLQYGRPSLAELRADLDEALAVHVEQAGPLSVVEHHEYRHEIADHELVVRLAVDEHYGERVAVGERLGRIMAVPQQAKSLVPAVTNSAGETVYVCSVPSDTFGWLVTQLDPRGDALVAALTSAADSLVTLPLAVGDVTRPAWHPSSFAPQDRLSEIM